MDTMGLLRLIGPLAADCVEDALATPLNKVRKALALMALTDQTPKMADVAAASRYDPHALRRFAQREGITLPTRTVGPAPRVYSQHDNVHQLATALVGSIDGTEPGDYSPGQTLPSDTEIIERYDVLARTAQAARKALVNNRRLTGLDDTARVLAAPSAPAESPLTELARDTLIAARDSAAALSAAIDDALAQLDGKP
ncbi:hypothetical protein [Nocardia suismassiliense]|uniref:hypothetical protein n=1 Tax=Nocardia suismassiliense TaxID=2077092 RepID=UPI00131F2F70|nr:hypothetical protein [Nocardia suismassiliense]